MEKFLILEGRALPLDRANVDTDAILPKHFLKSIRRTGFGPNLFDEWRYLDPYQEQGANEKRRLNPNFVLNEPRFSGANILLARENFGCGSSREHAPWALLDSGFRAIIAPSFADIFRSNCFKNGILPIQLHPHDVDKLFLQADAPSGCCLKIDLAAQEVAEVSGESFHFEVDEFKKYCLLNGLDEIDLTLQHAAEIQAFEAKRWQQKTWL